MSALRVRGRCWKVGDNIPTDAIVATANLFKPYEEMARHVLASVHPEFVRGVKPGDVLVAGRHFACSSGRAVAPKALRATGIGVVVAESFARTFYRNAHEVGLPILECPGITEQVREGDELDVDVEAGLVRNLTLGQTIQAVPPPPFLRGMLKAGGLHAYLELHGGEFVS
ncbi:MAG: 3-isopropylmalate dehydratase [Deltaproteobacteria bacterium]|nr:3-isopropylmalate dehydratase [Deltaproteobacteria bacterium]